MNFYNDLMKKRNLEELLNFLNMFNFNYKINISLLNKFKKILGLNYTIEVIANSGVFKNDVVITCNMPEFKVLEIKGL